MEKQLDERSDFQLDRLIMFEALCKTELGKSFLKWLAVDLCGWGRSATSSEASALHDLWIVMRRYVPLQALAEIELGHLAKEHQALRALLDESPIITTKVEDEWTQQHQ